MGSMGYEHATRSAEGSAGTDAWRIPMANGECNMPNGYLATAFVRNGTQLPLSNMLFHPLHYSFTQCVVAVCIEIFGLAVREVARRFVGVAAFATRFRIGVFGRGAFLSHLDRTAPWRWGWGGCRGRRKVCPVPVWREPVPPGLLQILAYHRHVEPLPPRLIDNIAKGCTCGCFFIQPCCHCSNSCFHFWIPREVMLLSKVC